MESCNQANCIETVNSDESESVPNLAEAPTEILENSVKESQNDDDNLDDTYADIDLSGIELSTDFLDEMRKALDSKQSCDSLMNACSSTAQELKKTISEVLKSRENIVIAAGDTTSELEQNLGKKIADFETVVSGCCGSNDIKHDLTNIKHPAFSNVIITEVNEAEEANDANHVSENLEEKKPIAVPLVNSEQTTDHNKKEHVPKKVNKTTKEGSIEKDNNKEIKCGKDFKPETTSVLKEVDDDKNSRKQQKYSGSAKKRAEKSIDQILKSLSNCSTTEEKLQTLCKRHLETQEELRLLDPRMKQLERQVQNQLREKEQLQTDYNRMVLAKSRLESLCRELQRQNKAVKEESLSRIKEEEERRKEIANKFQVTLNDISNLMQEHSKKNIQLREENAELAKKLKALVDHYDMWEKHMEKVVHQNHLEAQLAKAKYAKINLLLKQETEKFLREKQSLLETMSELQKKCTQLTSNELKLRTELGDYTAKYEEFQTVLNKSSQVFSSFKNDMEATSKKIKKLEKETNTYKHKWESSNNALLEMINDKQKHDKELANARQRITTLEKLCRVLQAERKDLRNQLNTATGSAHSNEKDVKLDPAQA